VAYSAADGLARARVFDPGLLLCDASMPGGSGLQLAENVQIELPDCKLLMLTGYSSDDVHIEMQNRTMRHPMKLLKKPCRPELLLREASALLQMA
jgi:DNA-binding NarL/FixJ family response regulator